MRMLSNKPEEGQSNNTTCHTTNGQIPGQIPVQAGEKVHEPSATDAGAEVEENPAATSPLLGLSSSARHCAGESRPRSPRNCVTYAARSRQASVRRGNQRRLTAAPSRSVASNHTAVSQTPTNLVVFELGAEHVSNEVVRQRALNHALAVPAARHSRSAAAAAQSVRLALPHRERAAQHTANQRGYSRAGHKQRDCTPRSLDELFVRTRTPCTVRGLRAAVDIDRS